MNKSQLHNLWLSRRKAAMLRGSHSIIGDFINANDDSIGPDGIRVEYAKVEDLLNGGDISAYSEKSENGLCYGRITDRGS